MDNIRSILEDDQSEIHGQVDETLKGRTLTKRLALPSSESAMLEIDLDRSEKGIHVVNKLIFTDSAGQLLDINKTYNEDNGWRMIQADGVPMENSMARVNSDPPFLFFGDLNRQEIAEIAPIEIILLKIGHLKIPNSVASHIDRQLLAMDFARDSLMELEAQGYNFRHSPYTKHSQWPAGSLYLFIKSLPVLKAFESEETFQPIPDLSEDEMREIEEQLGIIDSNLSKKIGRASRELRSAWIQTFEIDKVVKNLRN